MLLNNREINERQCAFGSTNPTPSTSPRHIHMKIVEKKCHINRYRSEPELFQKKN